MIQNEPRADEERAELAPEIASLPRKVLIVENDERFADTLATEFRDNGYEVTTLSSLAEVKTHDVSGYGFGVIDLRLQTDSGLDVIASVKERNDEARLVVLTGYGSIATAVQATKLGATSYLTKPVDFEDVEHALLKFRYVHWNGSRRHTLPAPDAIHRRSGRRA